MTSFETSLLAAAELVAPELLDLCSRAQERSLPALRHITNPSLRSMIGPLTFRSQFAQLLDGRKTLDTDGWSVELDLAHMASIKLKNAELDSSFRLLKERDSYPGSVPTAKSGTKREIDWQPTLFPVEGASNSLLWLYDIHDINSDEHWETPLRFVRPLGSVSYGKPVPYDLSIPLVAQPGFYAGRTFETSDDANFFANIRQEENQSNL